MMNQLKVTYLVSTLGRTGPTNQLLNLVSRLDKSRFAPKILTISREPSDSRRPDFEALGIPVYTLSASRLGSILNGVTRLREFLAKNPTDLLHSQGIRADFLNFLLKEVGVRITTQRNDPFYDYPLYFGRFSGSIVARAHRFLLRRIPCVVACSSSIGNTNQNHGIKCHTICNGTDISRSHPLTQNEKRVLRTHLGLPENRVIFVSAAPFIERKNLPFLIQAYNQLQERRNAHLVLVGDGPCSPAIQALVKSNKQVTLTGNVSNVGDYMAVADCYVSASLSEGLPNAVVEALSWGLPAILSNIPAHREISEKSEDVVRLFPLQNFMALTAQLEEFQPNQDLTFSARSMATDHFSADLMAHDYQNLYNRLWSN